jgi:hypothetical protein
MACLTRRTVLLAAPAAALCGRAAAQTPADFGAIVARAAEACALVPKPMIQAITASPIRWAMWPTIVASAPTR